MSPVIEKPNNLIDRLLTSQILVGLDVGYKTIGIAVSDRSFTIATPINTVNRKGTNKDLSKIKEYLNEYEIGGFIVGLPISLDGKENEQTMKIRKFSNKLQLFFPVPVEFWDERYSSDIIFKESAILFESNSHIGLDATVCVDCPKEMRIDRVIRRNSLTREDVLKRMANQFSDSKKSKCS